MFRFLSERFLVTRLAAVAAVDFEALELSGFAGVTFLSAILGTSPLVWFLVLSNSLKRRRCVPSVTGLVCSPSRSSCDPCHTMGRDSVELREVEGIGPRRAGAAVEGVLHDEGLADVLAPEKLQDVRLRLHVILADATAAETACTD